MTALNLALILISVAMSAIAQLAFKTGVSSKDVQDSIASANLFAIGSSFATSPGIIGGLTLYGIGTLLWLRVLAKTDLSQAYPFVGLGFILTAAFGYFVFNEPLTPVRILGTALIIVGVVLVMRS